MITRISPKYETVLMQKWDCLRNYGQALLRLTSAINGAIFGVKRLI